MVEKRGNNASSGENKKSSIKKQKEQARAEIQELSQEVYQSESRNKTLRWSLFIIILIVVGAAIYLIFSNSENSDKDKIETYQKNYQVHSEKFYQEYEIAYPSKLASESSMIRALVAVDNAEQYLKKMLSEATMITSWAALSKSKYAGTELEEIETIETCYVARIEMINLHSTILNNEKTYILWYNYTSKADEEYQNLLTLTDSYVANLNANNQQGAMGDLDLMMEAVSDIKDLDNSAQELINFGYIQKYIDWANSELRTLELTKLYFFKPSLALEQEISIKGQETAQLINEARNLKAENEFDVWWVENVKLNQDSVDRIEIDADKICERIQII